MDPVLNPSNLLTATPTIATATLDNLGLSVLSVTGDLVVKPVATVLTTGNLAPSWTPNIPVYLDPNATLVFSRPIFVMP